MVWVQFKSFNHLLRICSSLVVLPTKFARLFRRLFQSLFVIFVEMFWDGTVGFRYSVWFLSERFAMRPHQLLLWFINWKAGFIYLLNNWADDVVFFWCLHIFFLLLFFCCYSIPFTSIFNRWHAECVILSIYYIIWWATISLLWR